MSWEIDEIPEVRVVSVPLFHPRLMYVCTGELDDYIPISTPQLPLTRGYFGVFFFFFFCKRIFGVVTISPICIVRGNRNLSHSQEEALAYFFRLS